jgi:hypothetical protein
MRFLDFKNHFEPFLAFSTQDIRKWDPGSIPGDWWNLAIAWSDLRTPCINWLNRRN